MPIDYTPDPPDSLPLGKQNVNPDPIRQFARWFEQAKQAYLGEDFDPTAMTLATTSPDNQPSARIVLLKSFDQKGFVFYTNYHSPKAIDLAGNPQTALVFHWPALERQVRIQGSASKVDRSTSTTYFHSRPRGSQIGAIASNQSQVISDRTNLEQRFADLKGELDGRTVPVPVHWGGFLVQPQWIEFWQHGPNRLHDRLRYRLQAHNSWKLERLSP